MDGLVADGYDAVTVLDISSRALQIAQARLGDNAHGIQWIEFDVLGWNCISRFDIWHDRATYHFLTEANDREAYAAYASRAVKKGGALIVANFALDGPRSCSGLRTYRANAEMIAADFAHSFDLEDILIVKRRKQVPHRFVIHRLHPNRTGQLGKASRFARKANLCK